MIDIANDLKNWIHRNFFTKLDFTSTSRGAQDAHRPIVLNNSGVLDSSLGGGGGGANVAYTNVANVFTRQQTIKPSIEDVTLGSELVTDSTFPSLANWNDDGSGWNVVSGGITHTPGAPGTLTQSVDLSAGVVYVLEISVTGGTTGDALAYDPDALYSDAATNGIVKSIGYVAASPDTISVTVDSTFDGRIEYVSLKIVAEQVFPATVSFYNGYGTLVNEIRTFNGSFFFGLNSGRFSQNSSNTGLGHYTLDAIVYETQNVALGDHAGSGAKCSGGLFLGAYAGINETVDNVLHVGRNGDIISGTMDSGVAATQILQVHAATIVFADIPTSAAGLPTGALWNDSGTLKVA